MKRRRPPVPPNLMVLPAREGPASAMAASLDALRQNMALLKEHAALMAQLHRAKYDALRGQNFTDAQALELCKVL